MRIVTMFGLWLLCIVCALVALLWLPVALLARAEERSWNIVLGFDYLGNSVTGGAPGELISTRANRWRHERGWACVLCKWLDRIDPGHCERAGKS